MAMMTSEDTMAVDILKELPSPASFYATFVSQRRPVVLRGCLKHLSASLAGLSSPAAVCEAVGAATAAEIKVEVNQAVGQSKKGPSFSPADGSQVIHMPLDQFCRQLADTKDAEKACQYYLTTQTLPVDEEGRPDIYASPVSELLEKTSIPMRPPLLGNLIPMTANLWMGRSSDHRTSTSGLHHDHHDNLYCLLAGHKTFDIAPPHVVDRLQMSGTLVRRHDNGRMVYQEQLLNDGGGMIRPDGALEIVERIMELQDRQNDLQYKLDRRPIRESERTKLEEELDAVEEELLDLEMENGDQEQDDNTKDDLLFSGTSKPLERLDDTIDCDSDTDDSSESADEMNPPARKKHRNDGGASQCCLPPNFVTGGSDGISFSRVEIEPGDLFYLPAGWFHNVGSKGLHIAFNYWMHPPDMNETMEQPYRSKYWQRDWEARGLEKKVNANN